MKLSQSWHQLFTFGSDDTLTLQQTKTNLFQNQRYTVRQGRLRHLASLDIEGHFRQMLNNPNAGFKGNQREVLTSVVRGFSPILYIAGTGSGKSIIFLLPAYCTKDGVTIVISPFVALQEDMARRCKELGIGCTIWSFKEVSINQVILITPEAFSTKTFKTFVNRLNVRQQLDRIVLTSAILFWTRRTNFDHSSGKSANIWL